MAESEEELKSFLKKETEKSDLKLNVQKTKIMALMLLNCGAGEDSWESLGLLGEQTSQS